MVSFSSSLLMPRSIFFRGSNLPDDFASFKFLDLWELFLGELVFSVMVYKYFVLILFR